MSNENNNTKSPEELKNPNPNPDTDLLDFFDNFLKPGIMIQEKEVVPGFSVKLKTLNTEELLIAESIILNANPGIPMDVIHKIRAASILSQSILALNGLPVEREDMSKEHNSMRRQSLYHQILRMPPYMIQKTYEFYLEVLTKQNTLYETPKTAGEKIENF